ncbi:MAG: NUDIX domain-containing protein [bacterium]|nr:NUDIX domain-containing protein [bacterium]
MGIVRGVVGVLEREQRYLMIRRVPGILAGGSWCFPGGGIEADETPGEAIVREVREEVGLVVTADEQLWEWRRGDGRLTLYWWRIHSPRGILRLNAAEVDAARWMSEREVRTHPLVLRNNVVFLDHLTDNHRPA